MLWNRCWISILFLPLVVGILGFAGCGEGGDSPVAASIGTNPTTNSPETSEQLGLKGPVEVRAEGPSTDTPAIVEPTPPAPPEVLVKTSLGDIRIRLFPNESPLTVDNFMSNYAERGMYDNTIFHYVEKDFIMMAGGYDSDYQPVEARAYIANEASNGLKNVRGTVAMSRLPDHIHSATCQFFINLADNEELDHKDDEDAADYGYCVFGKVVEGMEVVDAIAAVPVDDQEGMPKTPKETVQILSIRGVR
jgi:cyclophilin family peptidyl-prolyl cis-trans isomerase